jgi:hypothetical protein
VAYYELYRTTGGTAPPKLIYRGIALAHGDAGTEISATVPPTTNTTGRVLVGDGSAAAPSVAFGAEATGFFRLGTSAIGIAGAGTVGGQFYYSSLQLAPDRQVSWGVNYTNAGQDTYLSRAAAATLQLGAAASATPVAQTLQAQGGSGTDIAGANLTIQSGAGTGSGAASTLTFKTPTVGGAGVGVQTQTTRLALSGIYASFASVIVPSSDDGNPLGSSSARFTTGFFSRAILGSKSKALTDASATAFATFTIADGATYGGEVIYSVVSTQGTAKQRLDGRARFSATREGATYTVTVNEIGTQTLAAAAGTLTGAIEISGAAGVITLSANFNTSQTPDTFVGNFRFDSTDAGLTLAFP